MPAAALLQLALFFYFLWTTIVRAPFMDMLDWIVSWLYRDDHGGFVTYLWAFHNEHHMVWMRFLTAVDVELFHAAGIVFVVAGTAALLAAAAMTGIVIYRSSVSVTRYAWLAPMLILTPANAADCGIPIFTVYPIAIFLMIGCIALSESETRWHRALTLPIAVCAAFGNGSALVIWPVLLWISWRQRAGVRGMVLVALVGLMFIGIYTYGTPSNAPLTDALRSDLPDAGDIRRIVSYALTFLGLPFSRAPGLGTTGRVMGLAFLAAGLVAIVRVSLLESANTKLNRFAVAMILITLGIVALASIGRVRLDPSARVPVRYAMMVTPLHIGLLCFVIQALGRRARTASGWLAAPGFAVALMAMQFLAVQPTFRDSEHMRLAIHEYLLGNREPGVTSFIYPEASAAERLTGMIRDRGLLDRQ